MRSNEEFLRTLKKSFDSMKTKNVVINFVWVNIDQIQVLIEKNREEMHIVFFIQKNPAVYHYIPVTVIQSQTNKLTRAGHAIIV